MLHVVTSFEPHSLTLKLKTPILKHSPLPHNCPACIHPACFRHACIPWACILDANVTLASLMHLSCLHPPTIMLASVNCVMLASLMHPSCLHPSCIRHACIRQLCHACIPHASVMLASVNCVMLASLLRNHFGQKRSTHPDWPCSAAHLSGLLPVTTFNNRTMLGCCVSCWDMRRVCDKRKLRLPGATENQ